MTLPMRNTQAQGPPSRPRVDATQLWAGGAATALVAALIAIVGILLSRWLFHIPLLAPQRAGAWGNATTGWYALAAAAAALVATALMHLLALATPRPSAFFGWIIGLVTVVAVAFPFSTTAATSSKVATAVVNLVLGFAIGTLISSVTYRAMRLRVPRDDYVPSRPPARTPGEPWR